MRKVSQEVQQRSGIFIRNAAAGQNGAVGVPADNPRLPLGPSGAARDRWPSFTFRSGCILSTGRSKGFRLLRFSMADWASAIAHLSIGWGKVFWTRSWREEGSSLFAHPKKASRPSLRGGIAHLHVLHGARLRHAQHVEQLEDQLLDVLQGVLLRQEARVDLLLHLNHGKAAVRNGWRETHACKSRSNTWSNVSRARVTFHDVRGASTDSNPAPVGVG